MHNTSAVQILPVPTNVASADSVGNTCGVHLRPEWQPDFDRRIPTIAYELYILPCKFGRQQCAIPVDVFIYLSEVEYRTFGQFSLCAKPVSTFFPGEDFQSPSGTADLPRVQRN